LASIALIGLILGRLCAEMVGAIALRHPDRARQPAFYFPIVCIILSILLSCYVDLLTVIIL
jgi:hypothetical protein